MNGREAGRKRKMGSMELRVHFQNTPSKENQETLSTLIDDNVSLTFGSEVEPPYDYQILVSGRPSREWIQKSPALQAVIIPWAGIPKQTRELLMEFPDLQVHNLHHNGSATAELAFALLLAAAKHLLPIDRIFRNHDWTPRYEPNPSILLEGKQALILGYGAIGRRVGRMCAGIGMKIRAVRRSINEMELDGEAEIYPVKALGSLLGKANVLMFCLPATQETRGMIGHKELNALPMRAIIVNVARDEIIDEKALFDFLSNNSLASAGLDVWYRYPNKEEDRSNTPPSKYPFHRLENVVMSPHRAGGWIESERARMVNLARLLNSAARNEPMENVVDIQRGY
jgi:phosphoglycerate dehydrogenase-like enzyme